MKADLSEDDIQSAALARVQAVVASGDMELSCSTKARTAGGGESRCMEKQRDFKASRRSATVFGASAFSLLLVVAAAARADDGTQQAALETTAPRAAATSGYRLGAYADLDVGILLTMKQGAAFSGGVVYGPFRAGLSYATFLSNAAFGGAPKGFDLRANYILGLNAAYFIAQTKDEGFYVQWMFHIKQQGVTNKETGDHEDLDSLATGFELGYVWKLYRGLYVAPRIGALYYLKSPQGSDNRPIKIGNKQYDNDRHKTFDTYYIPTLSVGYSW